MKILYGIICLSILISCKQKPSAEVSTEEEVSVFSTEIPEEFLSFYMKFHSDSIFQMEHIIFPLQVKSDGTNYTKEEWDLHKPFADNNGEFQQRFVNLSGIIIEYINSSNQLFKMERRFSPQDDSYNLIYYNITNAFKNSEDWNQETSN